MAPLMGLVLIPATSLAVSRPVNSNSKNLILISQRFKKFAGCRHSCVYIVLMGFDADKQSEAVHAVIDGALTRWS